MHLETPNAVLDTHNDRTETLQTFWKQLTPYWTFKTLEMPMFLLPRYEKLFLQTYAEAQDRPVGTAMKNTHLNCHNLWNRRSTLTPSHKTQCCHFLISISFLPSLPSLLPSLPPSLLPPPSLRLNVFTMCRKTKKIYKITMKYGGGKPRITEWSHIHHVCIFGPLHSYAFGEHREAKVNKPRRNKEWSTLRKNHICNVGGHQKRGFTELKKSLYNDGSSSELSPALSPATKPPHLLVHQAVQHTPPVMPSPSSAASLLLQIQTL